MKFHKGRKRWMYWLFEAKKRFGLRILNDTVISNHIHLLVVNTNREMISKSIQFVAGSTAQQYNREKNVREHFGKIDIM
ncbi:MAG: transposase [Candidatus Scalindua sp.]|nr:transposase [Candidatus Scalindua sp.]